MSVKCPSCNTENTQDSQFCKKCAAPLPIEKGQPAFTKTLETPVSDLTRGTLFADRYEIIEELGSGGMGKVYRVEDTKANEEIALKLIRQEVAADKKTIHRFRNELTTARKIRHKNVCGMYDLGEKEGAYFITMEFVPGQDLKGLMRQTGQLAVGTTINIAKQICEGLTEAHRLGVVHRDLKPSNVMIDKDGNARIMDFGIARSLKGKGITGAGMIIGTPEYMSPEQVDGKETDQRSDIYSVGVILYEMLTGRLPFEGDTPLSIAVQHRSDPPKNPREFNAQIPANLCQTILKCLEKEKGNRYQTSAELFSDLDNVEKGIPTTERIVPERKPITSKEITVTFGLKKLIIPALIIIAAAVIAFLLFRGPRTDYDPNRVVVAIFENQTGDKSLDPLGRMASDWISQRISQAGDIEVVPTMSVLQAYSMQPSKAEVPQNAQILNALTKDTGAGTMITGAYYLTNDELHFQAHITDVQHQKHIHSIDPAKGTVDSKMDVIQLLSKRVLDALAVYFDKTYLESTITHRKPPAYEAYNEVLLGGESFGIDYVRAIQHFTRALELDPSFLIPKLYIAVAYGNMDRYAEADAIIKSINENRDQLSQHDRLLLDWYVAYLKGNYKESLNSIIKAEKLAPKNLVVNYIHGFNAKETNRPLEAVKTFAMLDSVDPEILYSKISGSWRIATRVDALHMLGKYRQELKEARKGQKYYPNNLRFYASEAWALAASGKIDAVREVIEESLVIVPSERHIPGDVMLTAARELRAHGHMEAYQEIANQAVGWFKNRLEMRGVNELRRRNLATALYTAEKWDEAESMFDKLKQEYPENIQYRGRMGLLAARKGEREKTLTISEELESIDRPYLFGEHTYMRARIASLLGEKERAVLLLQDAFAQGLLYGSYLRREMDFEPLRNYKPFQELLKPKG